MTAAQASNFEEIVGVKFDHVAIAAPSILDLTPLYIETLGGVPVWSERNETYGFQVIGLMFDGGGKIELLQALPNSNFLSKFLASRPNGGLHHVTFRVSDLDEVEAKLTNNGYKTFGKSFANPEWKEIFVDVNDASGVLIQLAQTTKAMNVPLPWTVEELLAGKHKTT